MNRDEPTIKTRVRWAREALTAHRKARGQRITDEADTRDLITDLCHALDSQDRDVTEEVQKALRCFDAERDGV